MQEIWKDIPNYEGIYQVSNLGDIKSLSRTIKHSKGGDKVIKERFLKPTENKFGYLQIALFYKGNFKKYTMHQLVAMAFLSHTSDGTHKLVVDHINGVRNDNKLENLQIITQRENTSKDRKNKTSKYTGVNWHKPANKWRAKITINGKHKHLGVFVNEYDAHVAYQKALDEIKKEGR